MTKPATVPMYITLIDGEAQLWIGGSGTRFQECVDFETAGQALDFALKWAADRGYSTPVDPVEFEARLPLPNAELLDAIQDRRDDPEFMARLRRNQAKHKTILDRLADDD